MSVHDTKIQDFTNVLKQFYVKVKALIPTKVSQLTNDKGYKTTDTTYTDFVKSGSGAKAGLVPAPPTTAGTSKYLREDGTWQVTPAAVTPVNNLLATTAGSPLDAVQGKVLNDKIDGVNSSLIGYPDMSQKIYRSDWQKSFAWTATQDCWVYGVCDTRTTTYASIICLNDAPVVSALTDNSTIAQSGSLFICKKGDVISKTVNGDSIARIDVYAMRDFTV